MFLFKKRPLYSTERSERGKRRFLYFIFVVLFAVVGGGALVSWASYRKEIQLQTVRISGAEAVSEKEISGVVRAALDGGYLGLFSKGNSFLYPRKGIEKGLKETFPRLAEVSVSRVNF